MFPSDRGHKEEELSETLLEKKNRAWIKSEETRNASQHRRDNGGRYVFKRDGLVKKTISARVDGHWQHLVCYYSRKDYAVIANGGQLFDPVLQTELRAVRVPIDLVVQQNFRRPPLLTASGPGQSEVPLTAAPRPRRHSALAGILSSRQMASSGVLTSSNTPVPIVANLAIEEPPQQLMLECIGETFEAAEGFEEASGIQANPFKVCNMKFPNLIGFVPVPQEEDMQYVESGFGNSEPMQPRWVVGHGNFSIQPVDLPLLTGLSDEESPLGIASESSKTECDEYSGRTSGFFLRGHDPILPRVGEAYSISPSTLD